MCGTFNWFCLDCLCTERRPVKSNIDFGDYYCIIFIYLSFLPVAHLSDIPRRPLVVTGDSARVLDKASESSARFFNMLVTWDLGLLSHPKDN